MLNATTILYDISHNINKGTVVINSHSVYAIGFVPTYLDNHQSSENNRFINFLQSTGILCSHKYHSVHHKGASDKYCVISVYSNYILDSIYFWRALEYIIFLFTGIKPTIKPYDDYYIIQNHMHENVKLKCPDKPTKKDIDELKYILKHYKNCNKYFNK
jgi:hypothetical protein